MHVHPLAYGCSIIVQLLLCLMPVSVKIDQETMTIVEDDAIDEDEVAVCIPNT